jgi:cytidylate kinase
MKTVIAIDGPAASGKSSVARELAERLHYGYVNSGAFYRTVTWWILKCGADPASPDAVADVLSGSAMESGFDANAAFFRIGGSDGAAHLREDTVNRSVSPVSRVPAVRECLMEHLRSLAEDRDIVMEGRDIGSVVFPGTPYKFYIDASPEVRKLRRVAQGQHDEIAERDKIDSSRPNAPLIIAEDALVIDSTHLTVDGVVGEIVGRLKLQGLPVPPR